MVYKGFKNISTIIRTKSFRKYTSNSSNDVASIDQRVVTPKRIMVFGDSNTFRPDGNRTCWPLLLKDKDITELDVINEGYDGRTTKYDSGECNGLRVIRDKLDTHMPLDYVVVMLGTNDLKNKYGPPSAAEIADGMRKILDIIATEDDSIKPIVVTPPPLGKVIFDDLAGAQHRVKPVVAEYYLLAMNRDIRLVDLYTVINSSIDIEPDGVHLNAVGRQKVADAVWANRQNFTAPAQVTGFSGLFGNINLNLSWQTAGSHIFYYRVRKNGDIIGRTMGKSFEIVAPTIGDYFTVEAVDFSQNTGPFSTHVTFKASGNFTVSRDSPSNSFR